MSAIAALIDYVQSVRERAGLAWSSHAARSSERLSDQHKLIAEHRDKAPALFRAANDEARRLNLPDVGDIVRTLEADIYAAIYALHTIDQNAKLEPIIKAMHTLRQLRTYAPSKDKPRRPPREWQAQALFLVRDHPEMTDAAIATAVGVVPGTLSRCEVFQRAAADARQQNAPKRGHVVRDRHGDATGLDAIDED